MRPAGEPPSPRAAHAAAAVGTMVVFQVIEGNVYVKTEKIGILELGFDFKRFLFVGFDGMFY
jgi:protein phosphatase